MQAFARFKNELWCMDFVYVDKLTKHNTSVKYLLVPQDLFDGTVDEKGMETKGSIETVHAFLNRITGENRLTKIWVHKGTNFAGELRKLKKAEGIQINSSMSETKAANAEPTMQSLKIILYRYMEDYGYKYIQNLSQFVTTLTS